MINRKNGLTYADSGVDIDAGNRLVDLIKPMVRATARAGADAEIGGFGGLFDLKAAGFQDPILVAATDGVGTKVKIAIETGLHGSIGIGLPNNHDTITAVTIMMSRETTRMTIQRGTAPQIPSDT